MIITICAKCSDMFSARLVGDDGEEKGKTYRGYVPEWMPQQSTPDYSIARGEHYGDYVELDIDVSTGRILNWKRPTARELVRTFQYHRVAGEKVGERI